MLAIALRSGSEFFGEDLLKIEQGVACCPGHALTRCRVGRQDRRLTR